MSSSVSISILNGTCSFCESNRPCWAGRFTYQKQFIIIIIVGCMFSRACAVNVAMDPINLETLRSQKNFLKSTKKQQKELEVMRKKQMKERLSVQKTQCSAIDKAAKGKK